MCNAPIDTPIAHQLLKFVVVYPRVPLPFPLEFVGSRQKDTTRVLVLARQLILPPSRLCDRLSKCPHVRMPRHVVHRQRRHARAVMEGGVGRDSEHISRCMVYRMWLSCDSRTNIQRVKSGTWGHTYEQKFVMLDESISD